MALIMGPGDECRRVYCIGVHNLLLDRDLLSDVLHSLHELLLMELGQLLWIRCSILLSLSVVRGRNREGLTHCPERLDLVFGATRANLAVVVERLGASLCH